MAKGYIELTANELAQVVAAAMGQNGFDTTKDCIMYVYDTEGKEVGLSKIILTHALPPLKVRAIPEDEDGGQAVDPLLRVLYPPMGPVRFKGKELSSG